MLPSVLEGRGSAGHDGAGIGLDQMRVLEIIVHNNTDLPVKVTVRILLEAVRVIHMIILLISHQIRHVRMAYVKVIHQIRHVIAKTFFGTDRQTDRHTSKVSYRSYFPELKNWT